MKLEPSPQRSGDVASILSLFVCWKVVLLLLVALSPGPGYDTSTELLLWNIEEGNTQARGLISHVLRRLIRWDAIYFVNIANRGYLYEQDWAFGCGYMTLIDQVAKVIPESFLASPLLRQALAGTIITHLSHALAAICLYELTFRALPDRASENRRQIARLAACLHVISPAGIFLSAPYTESLFALLNFSGMLCLAIAPRTLHTVSDYLYQLAGWAAAGVLFGVASLVRSNGLLSVMSFVLLCLPAVLRLVAGHFRLSDLYTLLGGGIGTLFTVAGIALPQYRAYTDYCVGSEQRSWCAHTVPSIVSFVQQHYWGNGFLAYWTMSNLPLFIIAAPTLLLLFSTAYATLAGQTPLSLTQDQGKTNRDDGLWYTSNKWSMLHALAGPQILLAVLAFTTFHVQIVNRISSGYPLWYIVIAAYIDDSRRSTKPGTAPRAAASSIGRVLGSSKRQQILVRGMVLYGLVQAGLYASFLPPA